MKKIILAVLAFVFLMTSFAVAQKHKAPPMNGSLPRINSTGWHIFKMYKPGKVPASSNSGDVIVFCKSSHFSYIPSSGIGPQGIFKVQGSSLTLTNSSADKASTNYKMTWIANDNVLKLEGGGVVFEMEYNGESTCNG
jgi:hypothetical protein